MLEYIIKWISIKNSIYINKKLVTQYFTIFDKKNSLPSDLIKRKYNRL